MLKGAIARRYAEAMFEIALRQNTLDRTLDDVQGIAQVFSTRGLSYLLREPKVSAQRKEDAIRQALTNKVLPTSLNLALLIVQRELVEVMPNIARELNQLVLNYKNEAVAEVTTATPIDETEQRQIQQALERRTGKYIIISTKVQPAILGGVIARVGDEIIDGSVRYRLSALKQHMLKGVESSVVDFFADSGNGHTPTTSANPANADDTLVNPQGDQVEPSNIQ